jgi:hypothetical protein
MRRTGPDEHPGPLPEIRAAGDSVTFEFDQTSGEQGGRLVIRCDGDGNVFASIAPVARTRTRPEPRRRENFHRRA